MLRGSRALFSLLSQISFSTVIFLIGGIVVSGIALIVYLCLVGRWEKTATGERRAEIYRRALAVLFCAFWIVCLALILGVDKEGESEELSVWLIPFDPASILIEGYDVDYMLADLGNWITAPWIHQRRIIVSLLNFLLFLPLGAVLPTALKGHHGYAAAAVVLLVCAFGFEVDQFVMRSGVVYADNVLMRFLGGVLGVFIHWTFARLLVARRRREEEG